MVGQTGSTSGAGIKKADSRFNTIDESKRMCPHLYVQHVATYRNGESEAGYWGEVDPKSHKVSFSLLISLHRGS